MSVDADHDRSIRLAEPFEDLRDRADQTARSTGRRPTVFIANLGALADNAIRTGWTRNQLATAGIAAQVTGSGFTDTATIGKAFAESGLAVAILTGSDADYALLGDAAVQALRSAGARRIYLAGKVLPPDTFEGPSRLDGQFHAGQDAIAALGTLLEQLDG